MVKANVSKTEMFSMFQVVNTKGNMKSGRSEQDFSTHMNQASSEKQYSVEKPTSDDTLSESAATDKQTALEKMLKTNKKAVQEAKTDEMSTDIKDMPVEEQAQILVKEIVEIISQIFEVTEEEIVDVMDAENMQPFDLIQPASLTKLITKLTGNENPMALLTDSENSINAKNLIQTVSAKLEDFTKQTNLTSEELQQQTEQMTLKIQDDELEVVAITKEEVIQTTQELQEQTVSQNNQLNQDNETKEKMQAVETTDVNEKDQANPDKNVVKASEDETMDDSHTDSKNPKEQSEQLQQDDSAQATTKQTITTKTQTQTHHSKETRHQAQGVVNQFVDALSEKLDEGMDKVSAARIVRQVVDEIKLVMKPETTSMELQLNPEHLGKVNINVSMKAGMITAQIAVTDAMVKEALENQIQVLRDNMNEQGMKIEAVEVVIAGHEFEQNLEKGKQENEEMAQAKKGSKRKLRITELEESEVEEISEDTVKLQTTSTISYQA